VGGFVIAAKDAPLANIANGSHHAFHQASTGGLYMPNTMSQKEQ